MVSAALDAAAEPDAIEIAVVAVSPCSVVAALREVDVSAALTATALALAEQAVKVSMGLGSGSAATTVGYPMRP